MIEASGLFSLATFQPRCQPLLELSLLCTYAFFHIKIMLLKQSPRRPYHMLVMAPVMLAGRQTHTVPRMPRIADKTIMNHANAFSFLLISLLKILR